MHSIQVYIDEKLDSTTKQVKTNREDFNSYHSTIHSENLKAKINTRFNKRETSVNS